MKFIFNLNSIIFQSEIRATIPSRRSKSEGPHRLVNGDLKHAAQERIDAAIERGFPGQVILSI